MLKCSAFCLGYTSRSSILAVPVRVRGGKLAGRRSGGSVVLLLRGGTNHSGGTSATSGTTPTCTTALYGPLEKIEFFGSALCALLLHIFTLLVVGRL
jgi:hypothetical protein